MFDDVHKHSLPDNQKIFVIIPAFNEGNHIKTVIGNIQSNGVGVEIVVVDDGSEDDTGLFASDQGVHVLTHKSNKGQWAALRTGFYYAIQNNADLILTIDADNQHHPSDIPRLIDTLNRNNLDLVMGSRFLYGENIIITQYRLFGIHFFNYLFKIFCNINLSDCTNGYRVVKVDLIKRILPKLSENQYGAFEFLIQSLKHGAQIKEIPIEYSHNPISNKGNSKYGYHLIRVFLINYFLK